MPVTMKNITNAAKDAEYKAALAQVSPLSTAAQLDPSTATDAKPDAQGFLATLPEQRGDTTAPTLSTQVRDKVTGKVLAIHSTTGDPHSADDFQTALNAYSESNGKNPPGFVVLTPGFSNTVRNIHDSINAPIQQASRSLDDPSSRVNALPEGLTRDAAKWALRLYPESVKTLPRTGLTLATMAVSRFLPAVGIANELGKVVPSLGRLGLNMLGTGIAGTVGAEIAKLMGGEGTSGNDALLEFGLSALSGGVTSAFKYATTKGVPAERVQQTSKDILDAVVKKNPALANNPDALAIGLSTKGGLATATQQLTRSANETVTDMTQSFINDVQKVLPTRLDVAQQATMRGYIRHINSASEDLLSAAGNEAERKAAMSALNNARLDVVELLKDHLTKNPLNIDGVRNVTQVMEKSRAVLDNFTETAEMVHYLNKANTGSGFNPVALFDAIKGKYAEQPGSLTHQVGKILGQGQPLTDITTSAQRGGGDVLKSIYNMAKGHVGFVGKYLPTATENAPKILPWMQTPNAPGATALTAQQASQQALRDFYNQRAGGKQ